MKYVSIFYFIILQLSISAEIPISGKKSIENRKTELGIYTSCLKEYLNNSKDKKELKNKVNFLMTNFFGYKTNVGEFVSPDKISLQAEKSLQLEPTDPFSKALISMLLINLDQDSQKFDLALKNLEAANNEIKKTDYSFTVKMLVAKWYKETLSKARAMKGKAENRIRGNYQEALQSWLAENLDITKERFAFQICLEFIDDKENFKFATGLTQFVKKNKTIRPWLKEMILGSYEYAKAWRIRGEDFANKVKKENWEDFDKHLRASGNHFKQAHKINSTRPEAATKLIPVAVAGGTKEKARYWFEEAVKAEVDYEYAYTFYIFGLLPRWGGSYEKIIKFGEECIATDLYDTIVPAMYVHGVNKIKSDQAGYKFIEDANLYPTLHNVLKKYESLENKSNSYVYSKKHYIKATHFAYALKLGKYSHVRILHKFYKNNLNYSPVLKAHGIDFEADLAKAFAMSGSASELVKELDLALNWQTGDKAKIKWREEAEVDDLLSKLRDTQAMTNEEESKPYFEKLFLLAQIEKDFHSGKWIDLIFDEKLSLWRNYGGSYTVENERTIVGSNQNRKRQYLSSNAFFKPPYTVEMEVESLKSNWRGQHLQAGFILGQVFYFKSGRTFWTDGLRNRAGVGVPHERPGGIDLDKKSKKHKLKVNVWEGYYEFYIDDKDIIFKKDSKFVPYRVSLGIMPWYPISGDVRYSNFRIKKIGFNFSPPENASIKEKIAFYKLRVDSHKHFMHLDNLALAYWENKQYKEALELIKESDKQYPFFINLLYISELEALMGNYNYLNQNLSKANKMARALGGPEGIAYVKNMHAWILAVIKKDKADVPQALKLAQESVRLSKDKDQKAKRMVTLACVLAFKGEFSKAVKTASEALKLNQSQEFQKNTKEKIALFNDKKAYSEP